MIYLDYNATTPVEQEVRDAMLPWLGDQFGNPSSSHILGTAAKKAVEQAREQVAQLVDCMPSEIVFTSGGTESNNHAIRGLVFAARSRGNHIITSAIEHPAVLEVCKYLETQGSEISYLHVDANGLVCLASLKRLITSRTILVTIMHANNEVGTVEPLEEISAIARERGVTVHTDAAQSIGKIPVSVKSLGVDMLSMAGHKLYAPKGVGALYVREGIELEKLMFGAGHERGRRAGTEAVPSIVALGKACEIALKAREDKEQHFKKMRDLLEGKLQECFKGIVLNGHRDRRLPNTLNVSIPGVDASSLVAKVGAHLALSAGAACHSGSTEISYVLKAMGKTEAEGRSALRFSTGRMTTESDIAGAVEIIRSAIK
ncbi:MAG: cysteine desulfurase family protein [Candidatus Eremiobacteraeota bacterium]|nr:cysteine desulfurase family protein [Candidatus Eremiobacteraeota bacterium]